VDGSGRPVPGVELSLTPLLPDFLQLWAGWGHQDWKAVQAATSFARTGLDGLVELPAPRDRRPDQVWAVWLTHPSFLPELIELAGEPESWDLPASIALVSGPLCQARVHDPGGSPVPNVLVQQLVPVPGDGRANGLRPQALRVLLRESTTDARGLAALASWSGPMLLRARAGERVSAPWIGEPRAIIELRLADTFTAQGSVTYVGAVEGPQRVSCWIEHGTMRKVLDEAPVTDGRWGPLTVPLLDADRYGFRLEGNNAAVEERRMTPPPVGSLQVLDFTAQAGTDLCFVIENEAKEKLADALVEVFWESDGVESGTHASSQGRSDGFTIVRGVPPGTIYYRASAPGYAPKSGGPFAIPTPQPFSLRCVLKPARKVTGRVRHQGKPVEEFEIVTWDAVEVWHALTTEFHDREDGSFTLESVPQTDSVLVANAPGLGNSLDRPLAAGSAPVEVELEIEAYVGGKGRVVDASNSRPIEDATLQPFLVGATGVVAPLGPPLKVGFGGDFELKCFKSGKSRTKFSAPGYSTRWVERLVKPGKPVDFAWVALSRRQELIVRLPPDSGLDFTRMAFEADGTEPIPSVPFDAAGVARVPDVSAGIYTIFIVQYDGRSSINYLENRLILEPGEDWDIEIPAGGRRKLVVEVEDDGTLPQRCNVVARLPFPGRRTLTQLRELPASRVVEFSGLKPGPFSVELSSFGDHRKLGQCAGWIEENGGDVSVRLRVNSRRNKLRVVDGEGAPIAGVHVAVVAASNASDIYSGTTDAAGLCEILAPEPGKHRGVLRHSELGMSLAVPVELPSDSEQTVELVFDPELVVAARLLDGDVPLPAVSCMLWDTEKAWGLPHASSGVDGVVSWSYLSEGDFLLEVRQGGYWSITTPVRAQPEGQATNVQLRRTGSVQFSVKNGVGLAVSGQVLGLFSLEFQCDVGGWLAGKRVKSSGGSLATDGEGRLRIEGLPQGSYAWSADPGSGEVLQGVVKVPPHGQVEQVILLP
jgi:hypothetical protein